MAIKPITVASVNPMQYLGLSTDVKPTENVPTGAVLYELDTKKMFMFDGDETWWEINDLT